MVKPDHIAFTKEENPEVMSICYAQGWAASPDYITKAECEAVTTIGENVFYNSRIKTFNEFRYFTSVQMVPRFSNSTQLEEITIPASATSFYRTAFMSCPKLRRVEILSPLMVDHTSGNLFEGATKLSELVIHCDRAFGIKVDSFGWDSGNWCGYSTRGLNRLYVKVGATGYDVAPWSTVVCNPDKCGFVISYTL